MPHLSSSLGTPFKLEMALKPSRKRFLPYSPRTEKLVRGWTRTRSTKQMKSCPTSKKVERKTVEKNRRLQMKGQCLKLASLVPSQHHPKVELTQLEQVDVAIEYIRKLKASIDELKRKRDSMIVIGGSSKAVTREVTMVKAKTRPPPPSPPVVEVRDFGSTLGVVIITESERNFMTCDVLAVLQEQGVDVMSVSFSFMDDKLIHIINCQATSSRVGFESEIVYQKLKELVF